MKQAAKHIKNFKIIIIIDQSAIHKKHTHQRPTSHKNHNESSKKLPEEWKYKEEKRRREETGREEKRTFSLSE